MSADVFFDVEGRWGMPRPATYDLPHAVGTILDVLREHRASAVFFVVAALVDEHPDVVTTIAQAGHSVGVHGIRHEDSAVFSAQQWDRFGEELARSTESIGGLTGRRPQWFRSPFLLRPRFYDPRLADILERLDFRYVANRELRFPEELFAPSRLGGGRTRRARLDRAAASSALLVSLNLPYLLADARMARRLDQRVRWLVEGAHPFTWRGLTEVPVTAPLDCDLVGLPRPQDPSDPQVLQFATAAIRARRRVNPRSVPTFHDWIVTGRGRLDLLRAALEPRA